MAIGTLYIISTPIGNLADVTLRALEVLKNVSVILSEDTRETDKMLKRYGMNKKQISYRDQNHESIFPYILNELEKGNDIAIVTDSGTPLISDPGFKLVRDLIGKNMNVISIPGPSAVTASLVVSGLPTDKFSFLGFLPKSEGQIARILNDYGKLDSTLIIYESPFRVKKLLNIIKNTLGNRKICVVNEITKVHEKIFRGYLDEVTVNIKDIKLKGEFVILIAKEGY
ncbi:MAG TPA: 16S rRNA (cytidine(1402)-2'-O)-methyltransferase [bacterium]|nr:16S rRNA (cytidine(1402)-2'-O)-methyltransferase [bacterium]